MISNAILYDVECYPDYFLVGMYSLRANSYKFFEYSLTHNLDDRLELEKIIEKRILIGFNNFNYDDLILSYLIRNPLVIPQQLYELSTNLVTNEFYARENKIYSIFPNNYDLMELHRKGYNRPSLKMSGVKLKHSRLAETPIPFDKVDITLEDIKLIKNYNKNDLEITKIILEKSSSALSIREMLYEQYKISRLRSASESGATKLILDKLFTEQESRKDNTFDFKEFKRKLPQRQTSIILGEIIYDSISFSSSCLQEFLNKFKNLEVSLINSSDDFKENSVLEFDNKTYNILKGGIHSIDDSGIFHSDNEKVILDLDITSMYPSAILNNNIIPDGVPIETLDILRNIVQQRVASKDIATKLKKDNQQNTAEYIKHKGIADSLKIIINTWYGIMGDPTYWLYDPVCVLKVTINNQLQMLMLIEELALANIHTISANTDGITLIVDRNRLDEVRTIYKQWELKTKFRLEESFYKTLVRRDINNYLAVYEDGKTKEKGIFVHDPDDLLKSSKFPIIPIALRNYYINGISPEETIFNHRDIYDFCFTEKSDKSFQNNLFEITRSYLTHSPKTGKILKVFRYEELSCDFLEKLGRIYRIIVTLPTKTQIRDGHIIETGKVIKKCKNGKQDNVAGLKDCFVTLFNDYFEVKNFSDYRLNYQYYIDRVYEEISKIGFLEDNYDYTKVPLFCNSVYKKELTKRINELRVQKSLSELDLQRLSDMILVYRQVVNQPISL